MPEPEKIKTIYSKKNFIPATASAVALIYIIASIYLLINVDILKNKLGKVESDFASIRASQENLSRNFSSALFADHVDVIEKIKLEHQLGELRTELEGLKATEQGGLLSLVSKIYDLYMDFESKVKRNNGAKLDTAEYIDDIDDWGLMLINQDLEALESSISAENKKLDEAYQKYLATLPPPAPRAGGGYSYLTVNTEKGTFGVYLIKMPKSQVRVKTVAAIEDDCSNNCPTKSLAQYASENGAFAGMTGSYSCPADYPQCAGKIWSFDFALYDSNDGKWFNKDALTWFETGMMTFNGNSSKFYKDTSDYDGDGVTAAVSNFPSLLEDGNIVVDEGDTDSYQEVKGLRGAVGVDDNNIYLAYITGASVIDSAYAMRALGATDALNLDGGGTAAMYVNGGYVVGPGRPLASAILLIR